MRSYKVGAVIAIAAVVVLGLFWVIGSIIANNSMNSLENRAEAKEKMNQNLYSELRTTLSQKANITWASWDNIADLELAVMNARYEKGGAMIKVVGEGDGPDTSKVVELSSDLARTIEALFAKFRDNQDELFRIQNTYNDMRDNAPTSWWVGDRDDLVVRVVLAKGVSQDFNSGIQSELDLGPNKRNDKAESDE